METHKTIDMYDVKFSNHPFYIVREDFGAGYGGVQYHLIDVRDADIFYQFNFRTKMKVLHIEHGRLTKTKLSDLKNVLISKKEKHLAEIEELKEEIAVIKDSWEQTKQ